MTDINLSLLDCSKTQEQEINEKEYKFSIEFLDVKNNDFRLLEVKNNIVVDGNKAIILRVVNSDSNTTIQERGTANVNLIEKIRLTLNKEEKIRVFYWNNDKEMNDDVFEMFKRLFEKYGLDDNIPVGKFRNPTLKEILTPKEAGNGGVVGVSTC